MGRRALAVATVAQLLVAAVAPAEERPDPAASAAPARGRETRAAINLPVGDRVRLNLGGMRVEGRVSSSDDQGLTIVQENGVAYRAARESLDGLEVSRPRPRLKAALRAGLIGAAVMGGLGAVTMVGQEKLPDGSCTDSFQTPQECTTGAQVAEMAAISGFVGVVIGLVWPGQQWERVKMDRVRVGVGPAPGGGVAAQATVGF